MAKKPTKLSDDSQRKKAEAFLKAKDAGKRQYIAADKLLEELLAGGVKPGEAIELSNGRKVTLTDNFAEKNKHYKTVTVGRYELVLSYMD